MSNRTKTPEELMNGKVGAVMKTLKKSGVYVDPKTLDAMKVAISKAIDPGIHYQIKVVSEVELAYDNLYLTDFKECDEDYSVGGKTQRGRIVFGKAEFGNWFERGSISFARKVSDVFMEEIEKYEEKCESQMLSENCVYSNSDFCYSVGRKPVFGKSDPYVGFVEETNFHYGGSQSKSHYILIYVPETGERSKVDAVLKGQKRFLPEDAVNALEDTLRSDATYDVKVIHSAKRAWESLILRGVTTKSPGYTQKDFEVGFVVYGDVEFGLNTYTVKRYEEEGEFRSTESTFPKKPKFDEAKPFVVLITNKRTRSYANCSYEDQTRLVIIYSPTA